MRSALLATLAAAGGLAVTAAGASAATEIGQPVTPNIAGQCLIGTELAVQTSVSSGNSYAVPAAGTLTSFSTRAWVPLSGVGASAQLSLAVYRPTATPGEYLVVGVSEALELGNSAPASPIVTPITPIAVEAGDLLGIVNQTNAVNRCAAFTLSSADDIEIALFAGAPVAGDVVELESPPVTDNFRLSIAANFIATCDSALAPVGCWHFDETSGTTAADASSFANHGEYVNGPVLGILGVRNTGITLDGVNDFVRVPHDASLNVGDSFSLEGWVKRSSTTRTHTLMNKGGTGFQLAVMNAANGNQVWLRRANGTTIARSTGEVPADGLYHHIVVTKDGTGAGSTRIYIDGVEGTTSVAPAVPIANTTFPLAFGTSGSSSADFDEFAVYDSVLTQEQIDERYEAGGGAPQILF
ncbi:MAG: LamG domain-containing protein [Solirubrobacteraceae bacterium]|nr:LamG domain-containing protein [Solirubrobacteraceae bacterium]